jgi:hypothetical protein
MKKKLIRMLVIFATVGVISAISIIYYMFNMPHRNVQNAKTDFTLTSTEIVNEYLSDAGRANEKYLSEDGESKILEITGKIDKISENFNGEVVLLLKNENDKAGVSATFTNESNTKAKILKSGQTVTVKGVIHSGAAYDEDLELYENVTLNQCDIIE